MWRKKTNRGRVVYDRKPSRFTACDVARVVRAVRWDFTEDKYTECLIDSLATLLIVFYDRGITFSQIVYTSSGLKIIEILDSLAKVWEGKEYAGGTFGFGGAGATREDF